MTINRYPSLCWGDVIGLKATYGLKRSRFVSMCAAGTIHSRSRKFGKI